MSEELNVKAEQYCRIAENSIKQLLGEFVENPAYFFSESDVKCRLFQLLFQHKQISTLGKTIDGKLTLPLHTEVSYFNDEGQLLFHVDLSAVDPLFTDTFSNSQNGGVKLSKGYSAKMCYFAIELKLNKLAPKNDMMEKWIADMEKLTNIKKRNPFLACFSILFDKTANSLSAQEFKAIIEKYGDIKILYANTHGNTYYF